MVAFISQAEVFGTDEEYYNIFDDILMRTSILASSVGTTDAWHTISIPSADQRVLRPNEYYALVFYTIGGDASNYYVIHSSAHSIIGKLLKSSNSGGTWDYDNFQDLSFKLDGVAYVKLYSGTISNNIITPLGKVLAASDDQGAGLRLDGVRGL